MLRVARYRHGSLSLIPHFCARRISQKKDLSSPFPAKYDPGIEEGWYDWWRDQGYFKPNSNTCSNSSNPLPGVGKKRFSMVLPPPNVTGVLHLGHALTATVQDVLVRYHRMRGCETVWIPGSDHAGIATQVVVEKKLLSSKGLTRHQLGREKFLNEVVTWQREKEGRILEQLCKMGASLDWSREQFTMSPSFKTAVDTAFVELFDRGLIYRSEHQLVKWSSTLQSAISDIEVEHVEVSGKTEMEVPGLEHPVTFGVMTNIAYRVIDDEKEELVVGTTRPETMLGDTAVAVHPDDPRYVKLHGKSVWHPFRKEAIPIVTDDYVDPNFGTGAVKITPAHDPNDWSIGQRHGLASVQVLDTRGRISDDIEIFGGQHRFEARVSVCRELENLGLLRGEEEHAMSIPVCVRTGDVVEMLVKPQWFLDTKEMSKLAEMAVKEKDLIIEPQHYETVWRSFMAENRDWCLSRQIWWGHQIPAYKASLGDRQCWVAALSEQEARGKAAVKMGVNNQDEIEDILLVRDPDVLDTWFSSGLYPFAALGWPDENSKDLNQFYPLDLMETGHDILFFWVGRMVMLGIALTSKLPFSDVLLHGVITDPQGRKMSKSLGNVIDPLQLIHGSSLQELESCLQQSVQDGYLDTQEFDIATANLRSQWPKGIPAYGVDPLRWALATHDLKSQQIRLEPQVLQSAGAWCNKVWQLARFLDMVHTRAGDNCLTPGKDFQPSLMDMWILSQLAETVVKVNVHLEARDLHHVTRILRNFIYTDLCDTYVEYVKPRLVDPSSEDFLPSLLILHSCVLTSLKLLHPFMPFITEELFQRLPSVNKERRKESIMIDSYPQAMEWKGFCNSDLSQIVNQGLTIVTGIRHMKAAYDLGKKILPSVLVSTKTDDVRQLGGVIQGLAHCGDLMFTEETVDPSSLPQGYIQHNVEGAELFMDVGQHINYDKEMKKIEDKLVKVEKDRAKIVKSQKGKFAFRMSPEVAAKKQAELDEVVALLKQQEEMIKKLKEEADMLAETR